MSEGTEAQRLRMEMLRTRASLERAEVVSAASELRHSTRRLRSFASAAASVGSAFSSRGSGWAGLLAGALGSRPWLAAAAFAALRSARRHPWLLVAATGAIAVAYFWSGKGRRSGEDGAAMDKPSSAAETSPNQP